MYEAWIFSYDYESLVRKADNAGDYSITAQCGKLLGKFKTYNEADRACMTTVDLRQYIALIWDPQNKEWL